MTKRYLFLFAIVAVILVLFRQLMQWIMNAYCFHDHLTDNIRNNLNKRHGNRGSGLSQKDWNFVKTFMIACASELGLGISTVGFTNLIFLYSVGLLTMPYIALPVGLIAGGLLVCTIAKTYNHDCDVGRGLSDTLLNFAYKLAT